MIHFIYGKAGTGKSERIYKEIERVAAGKHVFLLVPDREAVAAESRMAELRGAQNIDVITFGRLCNYIFRAYGGLCVDYIGKGAKKLIMRNVIANTLARTQGIRKRAPFRHFRKNDLTPYQLLLR